MEFQKVKSTFTSGVIRRHTTFNIIVMTLRTEGLEVGKAIKTNSFKLLQANLAISILVNDVKYSVHNMVRLLLVLNFVL